MPVSSALLGGGLPQFTFHDMVSDESFTLPARFAAGRRLVVRCAETDGHIATVTIPSGDSLDGTVNGTMVVPENASIEFEKGDGNTWESYGGAASGTVTSALAGLTSLLAVSVPLYGGALANGVALTTAPFDTQGGRSVAAVVLTGATTASVSIQRQQSNLAAPVDGDYANVGSAITSIPSGVIDVSSRWQRFVITAGADVARLDLVAVYS